jgi:Ino eighty subunit 1
MASDNDAGSPARDYNSPAPSQGIGRSVTGRQLQAAGSIRDDQYDTDRTRSVSPSGSQTMALPPKPAGGMRINTLLNDEAPTPPPAVAATAVPVATALTATPGPAKGPGRGNWGHRRKEKEAHAQTSTPIITSSGRTVSRPHHHVSEEPDAAGGSSISSRPHGFYIPLNGQLVEPKRSRPLTSHQLAVEKYRRERVDFILDRGIRTQHAVAKRRRTKEGSLMRVWKRCRALPDGWDSEEEGMAAASNLSGAESLGKEGGRNGDASMQGREGVAATALLMMAGLRPVHWEERDWGEEAGHLASGMRKVRRRVERWETGRTVVRKTKGDDVGDDGEDEGEPEEGYGDAERSSLPPMDEDEMEEERMMDEGIEMEEEY